MFSLSAYYWNDGDSTYFMRISAYDFLSRHGISSISTGWWDIREEYNDVACVYSSIQ